MTTTGIHAMTARRKCSAIQILRHGERMRTAAYLTTLEAHADARQMARRRMRARAVLRSNCVRNAGIVFCLLRYSFFLPIYFSAQ